MSIFLFYSNCLNTYSIFGIILVQSILMYIGFLVSNNKVPLLDVEFFRENDRFKTAVYRKLTFSSVYSHFDSFLPTIYKFIMIYTFVNRCFKICCKWTLFHNELQQLKHICHKNDLL